MRSIRTTSRTRMNARYDAADIEVLSGLDPVKRRPGMYTDTTRPNHLAQEVVDNAVDEALAGHAREIDVVLYADGSCAGSDDGRGIDRKSVLWGKSVSVRGDHGGLRIINKTRSPILTYQHSINKHNN